MREFGTDYLFKVTIEPQSGYRHFEKRKKPYYVVAANKSEAEERLSSKLKTGWKIGKVSLLAEQYSGAIFGANSA